MVLLRQPGMLAYQFSRKDIQMQENTRLLSSLSRPHRLAIKCQYDLEAEKLFERVSNVMTVMTSDDLRDWDRRYPLVVDR